MISQQRRWQLKMISQGRCSQCGKLAYGRQCCAVCAQKNRVYQTEYRKEAANGKD